MIKALRSNKAESYIDVAVGLVVIMMVIVLALNVFSFLTLKLDMDYFAREMVDIATVTGDVSHADVSARYKELTNELGISPTPSWKADYCSGSKVQYGDPIQVTLTYQTQIAGLGIADFPITLKATYSGLSQKYWK